jgi:hypothetical protein
MKQYVVFLLAVLVFAIFHASHAVAGQPSRVGSSPRGFAASTAHPVVLSSGRRQFISPTVIIINSRPVTVVRVSPFAHRSFIVPQRFVARNVIIEEPFFCFADGIGFINEVSFFDHLYRFHNLAFEAIPTVVVHNGPQIFFFGN